RAARRQPAARADGPPSAPAQTPCLGRPRPQPPAESPAAAVARTRSTEQPERAAAPSPTSAGGAGPCAPRAACPTSPRSANRAPAAWRSARRRTSGTARVITAPALTSLISRRPSRDHVEEDEGGDLDQPERSPVDNGRLGRGP